jgi:isopentenyl phosphate kinase
LSEKPLIVIKLGGSALTDKTRIYTPRIPIIHSAASQVAAVSKYRSIMLVHGAGSYGHMPVRKYRLQDGWKGSMQLKGLSLTKSKLLEWETLLDGIFLKHGVRIMPFLASDLFVTTKGRITSAWLEPLKSWLSSGCVPIVGGDIVRDTKNGFSILSGDQIAAFLAAKLVATRLIYAVDVDGVFSANPTLDRKAQLLKALTASRAQAFSTTISRTTLDVTGGMAGKIKESLAASRHRIPICFVNLTKRDRLRKAALGQKVTCSILAPS